MNDPHFGSLSDDARTAIDRAPGYFMAWYTIKSVGLCLAVAALAFLAGRATKSCDR